MDIDLLATDVKEWADATFPDRTDNSMFLKLYGEIAEMIDADDANVEGEIADVLIMLLDFAKRKGVYVSQAIRTKMDINRQRVWQQNKLGAFSHVKDPVRPAVCVQQVAGDGSGDAVAGSETLAHGGDNQDPDPCRTLGQCGASCLVDSPYFTGRVPIECQRRDYCSSARSGGSISGRYSDPIQAPARPRSDQRSGTGDPSLPLFADTEGGDPD